MTLYTELVTAISDGQGQRGMQNNKAYIWKMCILHGSMQTSRPMWILIGSGRNGRVRGKVQLSVGLTKHQAVKTDGGNGAIAPHIL